MRGAYGAGRRRAFRRASMRTFVRAMWSRDPTRRPRFLLRLGGAARLAAAAWAARHRGRRRGARGELRGQGVRRAHGYGRVAGTASVSRRRGGPAADVGVLGGEQGG